MIEPQDNNRFWIGVLALLGLLLHLMVSQVYRGRNHIVRVVVDTTGLGDITGAILKFSVRAGAVSATGARVLIRTNQGGDATQAAVISADTVEFYLIPGNTTNLAPEAYTADAVIQTSAGIFQLLAPVALTIVQPVSP